MSEIIDNNIIALFNKYFNSIKTLKNENNIQSMVESIDLICEELVANVSKHVMFELINDNETKLWTQFLRKTLKIALNEESNETIGSKLLEIVFKLLSQLSEDVKPSVSLWPTLELICSHSLFDSILIDHKFIHSDIKYELIAILTLIYEKDIQLLSNKKTTEMIGLLLSAYNLSIHKSDQKLLQLLALLEKNGLNLYRYQPFLWGISGGIHYSIRSKQKETLLKEPKMDQILSSINENQLKYTLNNFPIDLRLTPIDVIEATDGQSLIDPRFLLPLFYQLLSNQSVVKCHKFVSYGCLSFTIACLSSQCEDMRCLAYCVLSRFYSHLETATFPKDRFLWIALIDCIRSGITSDNIRLKSLVAVFLIRIIDVLLHPNDKLYECVKRFLVNRPTIQFNVLPDFYQNLYSSDIETHKRLQRFVISWIRDGIRTEDDIKLCLKRNVFQELMTLFDSHLSEEENQIMILDVLKRTCGQYIGAKVLCTESALFCWLKQTIFNCKTHSNASVIVDEIYKIVETIWQTISQKCDSSAQHLMYASFGYEMIDIMSIIIQIYPQNQKICKYFEICDQIVSEPNNRYLLSFIVKSFPKNSSID